MKINISSVSTGYTSITKEQEEVLNKYNLIKTDTSHYIEIENLEELIEIVKEIDSLIISVENEEILINIYDDYIC